MFCILKPFWKCAHLHTEVPRRCRSVVCRGKPILAKVKLELKMHLKFQIFNLERNILVAPATKISRFSLYCLVLFEQFTVKVYLFQAGVAFRRIFMQSLLEEFELIILILFKLKLQRCAFSSSQASNARFSSSSQ